LANPESRIDRRTKHWARDILSFWQWRARFFSSIRRLRI
jgi:hypothetical protein